MTANNTESLTSKRPITKSEGSSSKALDPDLPELDARLQTISSKIIPASPYILTVPAQSAYPLSSHQTDDFRRRTPFNPDEDSLQYLSFLPDWDNGLIAPVGDWSNERGEMVDKTPQKQEMRNSDRPSKPGAKKISLSAYKDRVTDVNGAAKVNEKTSVPRREVGASGNGASLSQGGSSEKKRPASAMSSSDSSAGEIKSASTGPTVKKARLSPLPSESPPVEVPRKNKSLLPPPISPTLPPAIEKELARLSRLASPAFFKSKQKSEGTSTASSERLGGLSNNQAPALEDVKHSGVKRDATRLGLSVGTKAPNSQDSGQAKASKHLPKPTQNGKVSPGAAAYSRNQKRDDGVNGKNYLDRPQATSNGKTKSLIIKLRIPKSRRKDYARLVAMTARPKKEVTKAAKAQAKGPVARPVERDGKKLELERHSHAREAQPSAKSSTQSSKSMKDATKVPEKRPRLDEEDESPESRIKRRKNSQSAEGMSKPTTPSNPAFKSPVLSHHGSAQKTRDLTPNPDGRVFGGRAEDTVRTPQGSVRNGTPAEPSSVDKLSRSTSSLGNALPTPAEEIQALWREQKRHSSLGRALKHESDATLKDPAKGRADDAAAAAANAKHGLAMALESTLCFMLAYHLGDEIARLNRRPADPGSSWGTIYGWTSRVHAAARQAQTQHRGMHALSLQLEAVCKMTHWTAEYEQQHSQQHSQQQSGGNSSGGGDAAARAAKRRWDEARRLFADAAAELAPDELALAFPQTWRARAAAPLACASASATPGTAAAAAAATAPRASSGIVPLQLAGDFFVPLSAVSTPLEAVRAARSMLGEWCLAEGVDWEPKIGL